MAFIVFPKSRGKRDVRKLSVAFWHRVDACNELENVGSVAKKRFAVFYRMVFPNRQNLTFLVVTPVPNYGVLDCDVFIFYPVDLANMEIRHVNNKKNLITMIHGAGGSIMHDLVANYIVKFLGGFSDAEVPLEALDDAAAIGDIVFKSDSHAVKPIFFPGGDIGRLAISGTVNDIAALGAEPYALACGLILEEGLSIVDLERILASMHQSCVEAGVGVVTGDTKVVEKGSLGGCVMNVSGIGKRTAALEKNLEIVKRHRKNFTSRWILDSNLSPGDKIILSGTIGDHGLAVLSAQQGLKFGSEIKSDVKPLNRMVQRMLEEVGGVVGMKDPTRGGLADALNEFSEKSKTGILIDEKKVPIREDVQTACEMLGLDPLEVGNEGKLIVGAVPAKTEELLEFLKETKEGKNAEIIGEASFEFEGVAMETLVGGKRILARPVGDPVPRIC